MTYPTINFEYYFPWKNCHIVSWENKQIMSTTSSHTL